MSCITSSAFLYRGIDDLYAAKTMSCATSCGMRRAASDGSTAFSIPCKIVACVQIVGGVSCIPPTWYGQVFQNQPNMFGSRNSCQTNLFGSRNYCQTKMSGSRNYCQTEMFVSSYYCYFCGF